MGHEASYGALELENDPSRATGYMPFFIVYGSEAVLPTDLDYEALRIRAYDEQGAKASLENAMDQLDEACDVALLRSAKYQHALHQYHGRRVQVRHSTLGIWCSASFRATRSATKLSSLWEGSYVVAEVLRPRTYKLTTIDGRVFINAWNIEQLHRFYP
ncbi:uncharacterized protein [Miscanthus floridulus]|uniref:uncharacterized protein n=1 Tax=Miscanthus floridulus TaxID=154761 RepID=UPI003459AF90